MACRVILAIVCFVLVSGVLAEEPRPCCWIRQMTGKAELQSTTELADGTVVLEETFSEFAYDAVFEARSFIFTETFDNGTQRVGRLVEFSSSGVAFYIDNNQGVQTCQRGRIPARFNPNCIPEDSQYRGNLTFGDNALTGHQWRVNREQAGFVLNTTFLFAADYCVPITFSYVLQNFNVNPPEPHVVVISYGDIELGICDREKYFKIPDECPQDGAALLAEKFLQRRQLLELVFAME